LLNSRHIAEQVAHQPKSDGESIRDAAATMGDALHKRIKAQ
jgi:hypothetical protein